ncbi:beta-lactamase/transpeptidase-like protein [Xylaria sp. FL0933]|nr:beta-lactamase/transpeptidase-like protein [Xylaria sp. FL0933]
MFSILRIFSPLVLATKIIASDTCVLAGPGFPSPSHLSNSPALTETISKLEQSFQDSGLHRNDTAWAVALFSSKENKTLYEQYYTPPIDVGVPKVERDSTFRLGSVSKVFTVWSFLIEVGDERLNDPITKYVPELTNSSCAEGTNPQELYNDIDHVRWDEVTLAQLASHAAGIPRDPTGNEIATELDSAQVRAFGFPTLDKAQIPICGVPGTNRTCTRAELFSYLLKMQPAFPTGHSPAYSNVAFALLGYAQQAITGTPISAAITDNIFKTLGMTHSSYEDPPSFGVIPGGDPTAIGWDEKDGPTSPAGSLYSSTSDMIKAGQAMLQSTLISPAQTRRWLKPLIQTGYLSTAVGAPWEIRSLKLSDKRISQLYTKQGDEGNYHAALVLSPEHDLGWIVLTAGTATADATTVRDTLMNSFGDFFLPMAEQQAADEAKANFAGAYVDEATNSSVTVQTGPSGSPGLLVANLISRGVQVVGPESPLIQVYNAGQYARLYPSTLRATSLSNNGSGTYNSRLGFRATFFNQTESGEVEDPCLYAWTAIGAPTYGLVSLDDWVFHMGEDGQAEFLEVRLLRVKMARVL